MAATTHYIAANGSDSNNGTSKTTPWLHAPGMPSCSATCASYTPVAGDSIILRGGDSWHFGNSSLSPYTGGTWDIYTVAYGSGKDSSCIYEGTQTGCVYWGVDQTWYSGSTWARPILDGDNPLSNSLVASCPYQVANTGQYVTNEFVSLAPDTVFDNFEMRGLCSKNPNGGNGNQDGYVAYLGTGIYGTGMAFENNLYVHGWTATTTAGQGNNSQPCVLFGGGANGLQSIDHLVVDGSDSNAGSCAWATFPSFYHLTNSIVRYTQQGVGAWCHDIHDNIFEYIYEHNSGAGSHSNILECNDDSAGNAVNQPQNTPNVFYNNIVRHVDSSFVSAGQVNLWFCPTAIPEYWFNNVIYDAGKSGNFWSYAGPSIYTCPNTGHQYMFNNTFADGNQICHITTTSTGGEYIVLSNEHLINSPFFSDNTTCTGGTSATNIAQSDATGTTQGYTLGSGGISGVGNTCANESTTPCAPTSGSNSTVGAGTNNQSYCTTLAGYTAERAIGTDAANACMHGTTDAIAYNTSTHATVYPAQTPVARPVSAAWDSGAYQFSVAGAAPNAPTGLTATVN
ncbi:MAG: hypothetical protein WCC37_20970 [Candidatus Sulfotelmatobacter sp.]